MKRDTDTYLRDILESLSLIQEYVSDLTGDEFQKHRQVQDSVVRRFEIMGEAVKQLPAGFTKEYPHIPWGDIAGMRDILIHEYFGIKWKRVWDTIQEDLPVFKRQLEELIGSQV